MADLVALNDKVDIRVADNGSVGVQITGTFVATISFQISIDGISFVSFGVVASGAGGDLATVSSASAPGLFRAKCSGYAVFRAIITAYTSGIVVVQPRVGKYS